MQAHPAREAWPELSYAAWRDTGQTLHLWTQVVGKIRLALSPWLNHSWHVALHVDAHGLTTGPIAYGTERVFALSFDFVEHVLRIQTSDQPTCMLPLEPQPVSELYGLLIATLAQLGIVVRVFEVPSEIPDPIAFSADQVHASYDREQAERFFHALLASHRVLELFRTEFVGKSSPVHFFWGSFDLAVTRFSGRRAPPHPGGVPHLPRAVAREAYSHEVSSAGFWPGSDALPEPVFYAYAYPEPAGLSHARVRPEAAYYHAGFREFVLPYAAVRAARDPDRALLDFLHDTYSVAADAAHWDRPALECAPGVPGVPRAVP